MNWFGRFVFSRKNRIASMAIVVGFLMTGVSGLAQQDMQNMPGMSKSRPTAQKKRTAPKKRPAARKHELGNMAGMNMPGMKMSGRHKPKHTRRKKRIALKRQPAKKHEMGNMPGTSIPGMNMPKEQASPSQKTSGTPTPQPSPKQMQMNMPMPAASPGASPQKMDMTIPMPGASPSPGEMGGMKGTESNADSSKKEGMGDDKSTMNMDPYFTAINYPVPRDTMMIMALSDFQSARTGNNFFTGMAMMQYGVTSRWTVGFMAEGQKIFGLPATYGGFRINSYFRLFPHDHLLNFTLYGEYEGLNGAALYKMEVAGFGGEDLDEPLAEARRTPVRTFEQRAIMYHDWKRVNFTFNFISETDLKSGENDFGYAWGVFRQPAFMAMETNKDMAGMAGRPEKKVPPVLSLQRLGYGIEMIGALGNTHHFGFDWQRQQHYVGPVFSYSVSKQWTVHVEPAFGLSDVSDPFMLRMGVGYSIDHLLHRRSKTP
jgi:hypothetical protein